MDPRVADAVLEFGDDLRTALGASDAWAESGVLMNWVNSVDAEQVA
jgi:hypothetical protein